MAKGTIQWAALTLMSMANIPASPTNINAFVNFQEEGTELWIKGVVKAANPGVGAMNSGIYLQCVNILNAYGIDTSLYNSN